MMNFAQIPILGRTGFHPYYNRILNRARTLGYTLPSAPQMIKQNNLVIALVNAGYWNLLDTLYIYANDASVDYSRINWVNPGTFDCIDVGAAPGWVSNEGLFGGGVVGQFSMNWVPSTDAINYTLNNASFGVWVHTGFVETINAQTVFGVAQGSNHILLTDDGAAGVKGRINSAATDTLFTGSADYADDSYYSMARTGSTSLEEFVNGSSVNTDTTASTGLPTISPYFLARNSGGSVNTPITSTTGRFAILYTGSGSISQSGIYTIFNNYMTSL